MTGYKEWMSLKEQMPKKGCGLLIKFSLKADEEDRWHVKDNLFYGWLMDGTKDYLYIMAMISDMKVSSMSWKAHKEFDRDQTFWLYSGELCDYDFEFMRHKNGKTLSLIRKNKEGIILPNRRNGE